jgi:hypothetical protein
MTLEQVERYKIDQLWLSLERCQHFGREASRRVSLARDPFADVAPGVEEHGGLTRLKPDFGLAVVLVASGGVEEQ